MRKLMTVLLGLSLLSATAVVSFGQPPKKEDTKKAKKKGGKKKADAPKKEGGA